MTRKLPPLNSLRAFESAARHLSFTRAAEELSVTPGAISQQIKMLESWLGVKLFRRQNRTLLLTDPAQASLRALSDGFDRLYTAVEAIREADTERPLTVTVPPTLGSRWLVPRLGDFRRRHPGIDVRIDARNDLVDLQRDQIDIGLRFGRGEYPELEVTCLFPMQVFPVCSPSLLADGPALEKLTDLAGHTLLHSDPPWDDSLWPDWQTWLHTVGADNIDTRHGIRFTSTEMVIQAAVEGQGVALAGTVHVSDDLRRGRLIQPLKEVVPLDYSYYIVNTPAVSGQSRVQQFKDWLLEQVAETGEAGSA